MKVWVNGVFDVLHYGHFKLLEFAVEKKGFNGELKVGIDSDSRVKELKGEDRPFHSDGKRYFQLSQIKGIDEVSVFKDEEQLIEQIKDFSPDVMIIGSEYIEKRIVGREYVKEIIFFPKVEELSTTKILNNE